jgi:hypothetical protein
MIGGPSRFFTMPSSNKTRTMLRSISSIGKAGMATVEPDIRVFPDQRLDEVFLNDRELD